MQIGAATGVSGLAMQAVGHLAPATVAYAVNTTSAVLTAFAGVTVLWATQWRRRRRRRNSEGNGNGDR